jgi:hypothetical protein
MSSFWVKNFLSATFAPACPHVLLGREDFFMYFHSVNFNQACQKLTFEAALDWTSASKAAEDNVRAIGARIEALAAATAASPA